MDAPSGPALPLAGVIATSPATAPVATPRAEAFLDHSIAIQVVAAAAAESVPEGIAAVPLRPARAGVEAEPADPEHARAHHGQGQVVGWHRSWGSPGAGRSRCTRSGPDPLAVMWTTIPPAKSKTPMSAKKPPPPFLELEASITPLVTAADCALPWSHAYGIEAGSRLPRSIRSASHRAERLGRRSRLLGSKPIKPKRASEKPWAHS